MRFSSWQCFGQKVVGMKRFKIFEIFESCCERSPVESAFELNQNCVQFFKTEHFLTNDSSQMMLHLVCQASTDVLILNRISRLEHATSCSHSFLSGCFVSSTIKFSWKSNGCEFSDNLIQALRRPCPLSTSVDACWLLTGSWRTVSFQVDQHNLVYSQRFALLLREKLLPILQGSWEALRRSDVWSNVLLWAKLVILNESAVQNTYDSVWFKKL